MGLPHRTLEAFGEFPVEVAEARVLVARLALHLPIFFPEQRQGDAVPFEFLMDVGEVGRDVPLGRAAAVAKIQAPFKRFLVQCLQRRPVEPGDFRRLDVLGDDAFGDLEGARDPLERERAFVLEP